MPVECPVKFCTDSRVSLPSTRRSCMTVFLLLLKYVCSIFSLPSDARALCMCVMSWALNLFGCPLPMSARTVGCATETL